MTGRHTHGRLQACRSGSVHRPVCLLQVKGEFAHRVRCLNNFCRRWSTFEALVNTVPWYKLLGEELLQSVRVPLGELTRTLCSRRLKEDNSQACQQGNIPKDVAQAKTRRSCISGTFWASQPDAVASKLAETVCKTRIRTASDSPKGGRPNVASHFFKS